MADIEAKVKDIIINELGVEAEKVTPEASFVEDLGADSLDTVELVMAFEEEFGIEIPDEDAEKLQTVGDAIATSRSTRRAEARRVRIQRRPGARHEPPGRDHRHGAADGRGERRPVAPGRRSSPGAAARRRSRASTPPTSPSASPAR